MVTDHLSINREVTSGLLFGTRLRLIVRKEARTFVPASSFLSMNAAASMRSLKMTHKRLFRGLNEFHRVLIFCWKFLNEYRGCGILVAGYH